MDRREIQATIWGAYERGDLILACSWCARLCLEGEWLEADRDALSSIDARMTLSHGICPRCLSGGTAEPTLRKQATAAGHR